MPSINEIVDFLKKRNALDLSRPTADSEIPQDENRPWPWPEVDEHHEVGEVDWGTLFPRVGRGIDIDNPEESYREGKNEGWDIYPNEEERRELDEVLRRGSENGDPPTGVNGRLIPEGETVWDTCAWYQPIHFYGHNWGIYIKEECVVRIALSIAQFNSRQLSHIPLHKLWKSLFRAATASLFLHEHYHHKTESFALRLHAVHGSQRYTDYFNRVYLRAMGTDDQIEEALANADSFLRIKEEPYASLLGWEVLEATRRYLVHQFPYAPPGYRKAVLYLRKPAFSRGENLLRAQINEGTLHPVNTATRSPSDWDMAPRMYAPFHNLRTSVWTVIKSGSPTRMPVRGVLHYHSCSTGDMIRLMITRGYHVVTGGKGSHVKLKKPGHPTMILPGNRKDLSLGVIKNALGVLGNYSLSDLGPLLAGYR